MTAEPIAWIYQNANTEQQYLVWHKQTGGRNWMPLFTLTDVQEAILAEREACAEVAETTVCDTHLPTGVRIYGSKAAAVIRARGN